VSRAGSPTGGPRGVCELGWPLLLGPVAKMQGTAGGSFGASLHKVKKEAGRFQPAPGSSRSIGAEALGQLPDADVDRHLGAQSPDCPLMPEGLPVAVHAAGIPHPTAQAAGRAPFSGCISR
jgi:hypothetical protein